MIRYLEKMPEGQPVAVYMLSTKLTLLQDFTDDPAVLKKVAKEIKTSVSPLQDNPAGGPDTELLPAGFRRFWSGSGTNVERDAKLSSRNASPSKQTCDSPTH